MAPFLLALNRSYFAPDLDFVLRVGKCEEMGKVWEETRRYFTHPQHKRWLRRQADVRISVRKVINLAVKYLPAGASPAETNEPY